MMCDSLSEVETRETPRPRRASSSAGYDSSGGKTSGLSPRRKGPWTPEEDAILFDYVTRNGEGKWNAVQKSSGLSRCGKSCRLRWANHLRPDLKKGAFTAEEENLIIQLHARMGNKWAHMATQLPGRTDNEIKNYWNTRIKRLQRAGHPIYPAEVHLQAMIESQENHDTREKNLSETSQANIFDLPAIKFKNLDLREQLLTPALLNHLPSSMISSHDFGFLLPQKHLWETETPVSSSTGIGQFGDDPSGCKAFWTPYDPDMNTYNSSSVDILTGSHALKNGNSSSSQPVSMAMKLELPSFQYLASQVGIQTPCSPESVDTFIQSPLSEQAQSSCPSPYPSGLLAEVVYESQNSKNAKLEGFDDPISPPSQSMVSGFVDHTPISGNSYEEPQSAESLQGIICEDEVDMYLAEHDVGRQDWSNRLEYTRQDALLDSFRSENYTEFDEDQAIADYMEAILNGDDLNGECKQFGGCADSNQSGDPGCFAWKNTMDGFQFSINH